MYRFVLYYEQRALYQDLVESLIESLKRILEKWKVDFSTVAVETMGQNQTGRLRSEMRDIAPQVRGKIASARNMVLPLFKSKNLNTTNTPILVLYHDEKPINVYPHMLGTTYFNIDTLLDDVLNQGPETHLTAMGLLEEPTQGTLADAPSILEEGMRFKHASRDVGFGVADVLLQDSRGNAVVVEIETRATEAAVAQVSRLAAGYVSQNQLRPEDVRRVILCQSFDERTAKACQGADVELYRLTVEIAC